MMMCKGVVALEAWTREMMSTLTLASSGIASLVAAFPPPKFAIASDGRPRQSSSPPPPSPRFLPSLPILIVPVSAPPAATFPSFASIRAWSMVSAVP